MSTVKEAVLSPDGIVFEPLPAAADEDDEDAEDAEDDEGDEDAEGDEDDEDDEQAAAIRARPVARATQPSRGRGLNVPWPCERECHPPCLLLPNSIPIPLSPKRAWMSRPGTPCNTCVPTGRKVDLEDIRHQEPKSTRDLIGLAMFNSGLLSVVRHPWCGMPES
jgi:hypothetical protein